MAIEASLIPARFLTMLGHFFALCMLFYTRVRELVPDSMLQAWSAAAKQRCRLAADELHAGSVQLDRFKASVAG